MKNSIFWLNLNSYFQKLVGHCTKYWNTAAVHLGVGYLLSSTHIKKWSDGIKYTSDCNCNLTRWQLVLGSGS